VINNTVINNTTIVKNVNVTNITYANAQYHNAVIAANADRFGHGGHDFVRAAPEQVREWHSTTGGAEIRPSAASLVPGEGRAARPPQAALDRSVVALHTPNNPDARLHNAGLEASEHVGPAPRIVSPGPRPAVNEQALQQGREETARPQGVNRPQGTPEQHARTQPSAAPPQTRTEPVATTPARDSAEHSAPAERLRPPPPPGFNEWSKQQAKAPEGTARSAPTTAALPQNRGRPQGASDQHKLPGEPAMKLRPRPAAPHQQESPHKE